MRVLQVINSVDPADAGPAAIALQLGSSLSAAGDACEMLVMRHGADSIPAPLDGVPVHVGGPGLGRYAYSGSTRRWLDENLARFDAVVIHGIWQHFVMVAAACARARRVPYFVYPHGTLDGNLPAIYPVRHLKKLAYWQLVARSLMEHATGVCFTSEDERRRAVAFSGRWNSVVVGGGIQAPPAPSAQDADALLSRFPMLRERRVVLYMGRLVPLKGVDMLVRSFAQARIAVPGCRLLIAGEGTRAYTRRLASVARACGCEAEAEGAVLGRD